MRTIRVPGGVDIDSTMPIPIGRPMVLPTAPSPAPGRLSMVELVVGERVRVGGRLDVHTVADVRLLLHDVIDRGQGELLVELSGAEVGDATGLGVLVGAHHRARRAGRQLVLLDVSPRLDRLLRASRLHRALVCRSSTQR